MDLSYFQKINNTYGAANRQESDLFLLNRHVEECFSDTIDYHAVRRNGEPFELLIIKDSDGNTFKKKIKSKPSAPFNLGDYIEWNGQHWLITLLDPDDKTYHSGYMYLCTVPLRWQKSDGEIVERWCYSEDFTKYSSGVKGNNFITLGDNQYGITLPIDDETKRLKRNMRFPVDLDDSPEPDIYSLTNRKVNLSNNQYFGRGGTMILTLSYDSFNSSTDKKVNIPGGKSVWICDYHSPTASDEALQAKKSSVIINGNKKLRFGTRGIYQLVSQEKDEIIVSSQSIVWIACDGCKTYVKNDRSIYLEIEDDSLIGESILLQARISDSVVAAIQIEIIEGF